MLSRPHQPQCRSDYGSGWIVLNKKKCVKSLKQCETVNCDCRECQWLEDEYCIYECVIVVCSFLYHVLRNSVLVHYAVEAVLELSPLVHGLDTSPLTC